MALVLILLSINIVTGPQENTKLNQINQINHAGSRTNNLHKSQHGRIVSNIFTLDEMVWDDKPKLEYDLSEIDASNVSAINTSQDGRIRDSGN